MKDIQTIPVFFTFDVNYLLAAKVAIHSMMKHASRKYEYALYIFHTTLREEDQQSLRDSLKEFRAKFPVWMDADRFTISADNS